MVTKVAGLDDLQARRPLLDSSPLLTPGGIVKHLTDVERSWFAEAFTDLELPSLFDPEDPAAVWRVEDGDSLEALTEAYQAECTRSADIAAGLDLDAVSGPRSPAPGVTLRFVLLHMIRETARHCGHLDLLRESIDGQTGE